VAEIIVFKSREQLEQERKQRIVDDWNAFLEFERQQLALREREKDLKTYSENK